MLHCYYSKNGLEFVYVSILFILLKVDSGPSYQVHMSTNLNRRSGVLAFFEKLSYLGSACDFSVKGEQRVLPCFRVEIWLKCLLFRLLVAA